MKLFFRKGAVRQSTGSTGRPEQTGTGTQDVTRTSRCLTRALRKNKPNRVVTAPCPLGWNSRRLRQSQEASTGSREGARNHVSCFHSPLFSILPTFSLLLLSKKKRRYPPIRANKARSGLCLLSLIFQNRATFFNVKITFTTTFCQRRRRIPKHHRPQEDTGKSCTTKKSRRDHHFTWS